MIPSLLIIWSSLPLAWACIPTQPGEDMPCPTAPLASSVPDYGPNAFMMTSTKGTVTYTCKEELLEIDGTGQPITKDMTLQLICRANSARYVLFDGTTETSVGSKKYYCSTKLKPCQTCDQSKLVDESTASDACGQVANAFCNTKPIVTLDADKCPSLSCGADDTLTIISPATTDPVTTPVVCNNGKWMANGAELSSTDVGFVCMKSCTGCSGAVNGAYDATAAGAPDFLMMIQNTLKPKKPTCSYSCPPNYNLMANAAPHTNVVCDANMGNKVTADGTGTELSPTNQFTCAECGCDGNQLTPGDMSGICLGTLCVAPTGDKCKATCPAGSKVVYRNTGSLDPVSTGMTSVMCAGTEWIQAGVEEVSCQFDTAAGAGFSNMPVDAGFGTCGAPLPPFACPQDEMCDPNQLIYVPTTAGFKLMCKSGTIRTDTLPPGSIYYASCDGGIMLPTTMEANCASSNKGVTDCVPAFGTLVLDTDYKATCSFGSCYFTCANANQQFSYTITGGAAGVMSKRLKCEGDVYTVDSMPVMTGTITCV